MENEKLGQEPAFGFGYEKEHSYLNQPGKYRTPKKEPGISKRLYLAGLAMQGILTHRGFYWQDGGIDENLSGVTPEFAAKLAYQYADELLKQENQ